MFRGLFVAGTDTNVGKTVVSAALICRYARVPLTYWKPIQTGAGHDDDTAAVQRLSGLPNRVLNVGVRLPDPVSPHLAARRHGTTIDIESLAGMGRVESPDRIWIIEGAGGVLVPLNDRELQIDFIKHLQLPVLIVSRSGLGTINHTLLTIEALARRGIQIAGVIMVGVPDEENRRAIECYGRIAVVSALPVLDPLSPEALQEWAADSLDTSGQLSEFLR